MNINRSTFSILKQNKLQWFTSVSALENISVKWMYFVDCVSAGVSCVLDVQGVLWGLCTTSRSSQHWSG